MRALISLFCSPSTRSNNREIAGLEPNKSNEGEYYRAVLAEIATDGSSSIRLPIDLPESIRNAIDAWDEATDRRCLG